MLTLWPSKEAHSVEGNKMKAKKYRKVLTFMEADCFTAPFLGTLVTFITVCPCSCTLSRSEANITLWM